MLNARAFHQIDPDADHAHVRGALPLFKGSLRYYQPRPRESSQLGSRYSSSVISHRTQELLNRVFNPDNQCP